MNIFSPSSLSDFVYRQGLSEANCERSESRDHQQISRNSVSGHTTSGKELVIFFPSLFRSYPLSFPPPESLFLPPPCLPAFFPATFLINIFSSDICLCANLGTTDGFILERNSFTKSFGWRQEQRAVSQVFTAASCIAASRVLLQQVKKYFLSLKFVFMRGILSNLRNSSAGFR